MLHVLHSLVQQQDPMSLRLGCAPIWRLASVPRLLIMKQCVAQSIKVCQSAAQAKPLTNSMPSPSAQGKWCLVRLVFHLSLNPASEIHSSAWVPLESRAMDQHWGLSTTARANKAGKAEILQSLVQTYRLLSDTKSFAMESGQACLSCRRPF